MKNYILLHKLTTAIIIATLAISCQAAVKKGREQAKAADKPKSETNISYGDLIIKEQSDYLMIPVYLADQEQDKRSDWNFSDYEKREIKIVNIVFYHKQKTDTHIFLNKKAIIKSFDLLETKTAGKPPTRFWLYKIIDQNTNQDQELDSADAIIGYLSDLSGKNLQQITPNNTQIINWVIIPSQNAILLKIVKDSDNDKKFTAADKTNFLRVNLDKPGIGTEIISEQIEQQLKSYVSK
ncbi:hypothetical protein NIES4074_41140 [Cylindrospermum sp. NIES-4074]|nr:hypothetical protein NIES4074_41140 [Cylindrospermum sp. NIES-4074]